MYAAFLRVKFLGNLTRAQWSNCPVGAVNSEFLQRFAAQLGPGPQLLSVGGHCAWHRPMPLSLGHCVGCLTDCPNIVISLGSDWNWNTIQDVDLSNSVGVTMTVLMPAFPLSPHLSWVSPAVLWTPDGLFQGCVKSPVCRVTELWWLILLLNCYHDALQLAICSCVFKFILISLYCIYLFIYL
jgi:hypothetical protein